MRLLKLVPDNTNVNFLRWRGIAFAISSLLIAASIALLALPHGTSARLAPALLDAGLRVVDLAGDFRLDAAAYLARIMVRDVARLKPRQVAYTCWCDDAGKVRRSLLAAERSP